MLTHEEAEDYIFVHGLIDGNKGNVSKWLKKKKAYRSGWFKGRKMRICGLLILEYLPMMEDANE
jgi:hypothetical protein